MLAPLPALEAFRRDAASTAGTAPADVAAAMWLEAAIRLERAAMVHGAARERLLVDLLAQQGVVSMPAAPVSLGTVIAALVPLATAMEDAAFFRLAHSVLSGLLVLIPEGSVLERGRIIAQQARIARQLGGVDAAAEYYGRVEEMGREHVLPELVGRAWVGLGILGVFRGDYPTARSRLNAVLEMPEVTADSLVLAHEGLVIAYAAAEEYDAAAVHAWRAYEAAPSHLRQTEMLVNLGQILLLGGHASSALRGFSAALARKPMARQALPALGGAACAAAQSLSPPQARALVRTLASRVSTMVASLAGGAALTYESATALVESSEALAYIGESEFADRLAQHASELAEKYKFHELTYRLENPRLAAPPAAPAPETAAVIKAVESLEGAELIGV